MTVKPILGLAAASAFALWVGQAQADVFTLSLTAATPTVTTAPSGGETISSFGVGLSGFDSGSPVTVQVGDEVQLTLTFIGGPVTLPSATDLSLISFYLTGDGFPSGDTSTHFSASLLDGATVVASASQTTTTSDGFGVQPVFFGPIGALTFDTVTADFFVDKIGGSTDAGTFATLDRGDVAGEARNFGVVPEPASWALMLVGFGGLGSVLRSVRRRAFA